MRLDKWIWSVWMVKSRTEAGDFCRAGKVLLNGTKAKPAREIKIGDTVSVVFPFAEKKYRVLRLLEKRGPQKNADGCFENLSPDFENQKMMWRRTVSAKKQVDRKTKFRYADGRESKKDKRAVKKLLEKSTEF